MGEARWGGRQAAEEPLDEDEAVDDEDVDVVEDFESDDVEDEESEDDDDPEPEVFAVAGAGVLLDEELRLSFR